LGWLGRPGGGPGCAGDRTRFDPQGAWGQGQDRQARLAAAAGRRRAQVRVCPDRGRRALPRSGARD
jgi:hypothetical protein